MINVIPKRRILPRGFSAEYCRGCGPELDIFKTMDVLKMPPGLKQEKGVGYVIRLPRQTLAEDFSVFFQNLQPNTAGGMSANKPVTYAEAVNITMGTTTTTQSP